MPEYLHPGVYVEETSFRGKPIEGVSTSTAGLVGHTSKGPENRPTLVTSYGQYVREFGHPPPAGASFGPGDYLGHAVKSFFENGGRRAYIVRTLHSDAAAAGTQARMQHGVVLTLQTNRVLRATTAGPIPPVQVTSLRGVIDGATVQLFVRANRNAAWSAGVAKTVDSLDAARGEILFTTRFSTADLGGASTVNAENAYFVVTAPAGLVPSGTGPTFAARDRGGDGNHLSVQIRPADRPPVQIQSATGALLGVTSSAGFYVGGIVEVGRTAGSAGKDVARVIEVNPGDSPFPTVRLSAAPGALTLPGAYLRTLELDILVAVGGVVRESFTGLSWHDQSGLPSFSRYFVERINDPITGSRLVTVAATGVTPDLPGQPTTPDGQMMSLTGGTNGTDLDPIDLVGTDLGPGNRTGIQALIERGDISLVAVPGVYDEVVQQALITHCELLKYRFAVLDGQPGIGDVTTIQQHRNNYDTKYAGYYTPWLETADPATGRRLKVPPSGHVLGICARVDNERGVHKAPANEVVRGILDIELRFGDGEQDVLNPVGVNLIREFEGRGIRVWGGRTLSSDSEWKYVNVRRLFIYLEHSIDRGTQWVVFEPNTEALWARVVETIESFLFGVWKSGALMGTTPEDAFFVRCDRSTMTQDDIDNGRLVCLIGVAPAYPAEFVIFRIGQFTASTNRA